jgi:bifunctional DNase/RNase
MKKDVVPIVIRGILPANSGCAIFVGNDEKVFVIQVEHNMGAIIGMFLRETPKERPLTHDLISSIFKGFNITVERVVIPLKNRFFADCFAATFSWGEKSSRLMPGRVATLATRKSGCLFILSLNRWRHARILNASTKTRRNRRNVMAAAPSIPSTIVLITESGRRK